MPRIQPNKTPDAKAQQLLDGVKQKLGKVPNVFATLAHSPAALNFFLSASGALNDAKLSPALREQIALAVAGANSCDYCASAHTAIGKMNKLEDAELAQNLRGKASDQKVQTALGFAQKLVNGRGNATDQDVQALRTAGYSEGEIVEIVAVVAINIFTNYFNHVAGTEVDFPRVTASLKAA